MSQGSAVSGRMALWLGFPAFLVARPRFPAVWGRPQPPAVWPQEEGQRLAIG